MLADLYTLQWYGPAAVAIEVDGGAVEPDVDVHAYSRIGIDVEGGNQEPDLHGTLKVGWGVEVEGLGDIEAFGIRGSIRLGIDVDVAAQPTVFDIVQGLLNAVASQYNITGTVGNKINSAGAGGDTGLIATAVLAAAQVTPIHSNVKQANNETIIGDGTESNKFRSHLVP